MSAGSSARTMLVEHAVAVARVRAAAAVQVPRRPFRPRERPLPLVAPHVLAHHEDADRGLVEHRRRLVVQPVAEPLAAKRFEIEHRVRARSRRHRRRRSAGSSAATDRRSSAARASPRSVAACAFIPTKFAMVPLTLMSYQPPTCNAGRSSLSVVRLVVERDGSTDRRAARAPGCRPSRARSSRAAGSRGAGGTGRAARPSRPSGGSARRAPLRRRASRRSAPACRATPRARVQVRRSGARARRRPPPPNRCGGRAGARLPCRTTCPSTPRSRPRAAIATRCGGRAMAASHCVYPMYDAPNMPTRPFDHGCSAAHSTVSYPSSTSTPIGAHSPSDSKRPRESWYTTT